MTLLIISLTLFVIAVGAYAIKDLYSHGKLKWTSEEDVHGFWGEKSDLRKYKKGWDEDYPGQARLVILPAPNNWYYKRFKIKYKEEWPTSATATVFLTDGFHLMQFVFVNCLLLSFALLAHNVILWFSVFRILWWIVFNLSYSKLFSK